MLLDLAAFKFEEVGKRVWELPQGPVTITAVYSKIPGRQKWLGVGVDPGRNFGIATLDGREAWVFHGTLPKEDKTKKWLYGLAAYELMSNPQRFYGKGEAVVEGPAFKEPFGQSDLAHIRMGFVLGLYYIGFPVSIVPPATIRAKALGSGKLGGLEVWPEINHNAADALAAAIYAAGFMKEE
jgi:hypothetical protein